jgi:hypothetical protein
LSSGCRLDLDLDTTAANDASDIGLAGYAEPNALAVTRNGESCVLTPEDCARMLFSDHASTGDYRASWLL